ncbi:MAG: MgtC/SapB family protein [Bacteroidales bacterium]
MDGTLEILWDLSVALGVGLLIGIERGWTSRADDEGKRVAGIRTFSLVGLLGGVWAQMTQLVPAWMLGIIFLGLVALIIAGYLSQKQTSPDVGLTTEIGLLITFSLGVWASLGYKLPALIAAVVVLTLLNLKPTLHNWLKKIELKEIYAWIKLLIISVIFLPLLPDQGFGPWDALNPYWIWWMVVLISGLSFVGYILTRLIGHKFGPLLTSFVGGMASSTAITFSLAAMAKGKSAAGIHIFMSGVLLASSISFVRVFIEVAVVNSTLLSLLWVPLSVMFVVTLICGFWIWKSSPSSSDEDKEIKIENPLQLSRALKFGFLLAVILFLTHAAENYFGEQGIYFISLISGVMDVDAITLSLSKKANEALAHSSAVTGIVIAVVMNTFFKTAFFSFIAGINRSKQLIMSSFLIMISGIVSLILFV